jgi:hypothetical protein
MPCVLDLVCQELLDRIASLDDPPLRPLPTIASSTGTQGEDVVSDWSVIGDVPDTLTGLDDAVSSQLDIDWTLPSGQLGSVDAWNPYPARDPRSSGSPLGGFPWSDGFVGGFAVTLPRPGPLLPVHGGDIAAGATRDGGTIAAQVDAMVNEILIRTGVVPTPPQASKGLTEPPLRGSTRIIPDGPRRHDAPRVSRDQSAQVQTQRSEATAVAVASARAKVVSTDARERRSRAQTAPAKSRLPLPLPTVPNAPVGASLTSTGGGGLSTGVILMLALPFLAAALHVFLRLTVAEARWPTGRRDRVSKPPG